MIKHIRYCSKLVNYPTKCSRAATGHGRPSRVPFTHEFTKMLTKGSPRFGSLSHHSFFSRHNPHPHRVRHIQGEQQRKHVRCAHTCRRFSLLFCFQSFQIIWNYQSDFLSFSFTARFSEAWRDELKELAAKVSLSSQAQKDNKEVLELLCQILQTDSLSAVQRWLLLAGQREKDLVMGMIKQALDGVDFSGRQLRAFHPAASPPACAPSLDQGWRKPRGMWSG
uniref:Thymus, brain and testes associated n=1 Tax=Echeneis naucrates TaxID=173247 RepID=A0A665X6H5_ECHNA